VTLFFLSNRFSLRCLFSDCVLRCLFFRLLGQNSVCLGDGIPKIPDAIVNGGMLFIPLDPKELKTLTWIDEKAGVQFTIAADLDEPELVRLAESLGKLK